MRTQGTHAAITEFYLLRHLMNLYQYEILDVQMAQMIDKSLALSIVEVLETMFTYV